MTREKNEDSHQDPYEHIAKRDRIYNLHSSYISDFEVEVLDRNPHPE